MPSLRNKLKSYRKVDFPVVFHSSLNVDPGLRVLTEELPWVVDVHLGRTVKLDVNVQNPKNLDLFGHGEGKAVAELGTVCLTPKKI